MLGTLYERLLALPLDEQRATPSFDRLPEAQKRAVFCVLAAKVTIQADVDADDEDLDQVGRIAALQGNVRPEAAPIYALAIVALRDRIRARAIRHGDSETMIRRMDEALDLLAEAYLPWADGGFQCWEQGSCAASTVGASESAYERWLEAAAAAIGVQEEAR
jgi:hypothetical protein